MMKPSGLKLGIFVILLSAIFVLVTGCASKRHLKSALKFEEAGLFEEAANFYMRSLSANRDNIDSRLGLIRTGQLVLDEKLRNFSAFHRNNQNKDAVNAYLDAERYYKQVNSMGVRLDFDTTHQVYFNESKEAHLQNLYNEGLKAIDLENFSTARPIFTEILNIDKTYKDANDHWITATYEPIYRNGLEYMSNELFRKAYYSFNRIVNETGGYKDALPLRNQTLEKARIDIAVVPFFVNSSSHSPHARELQSKTISAINRLESPFYRIINDPALNSLPQLSQIGNPMLAIELVKESDIDLTTDHLLIAQITRLSENTGSLQKSRQKAYLKEQKEVTHEDDTKETITEYHKTSYIKYERQSNASFSVEFSLINIQSGEIMIKEIINLQDRDHMLYANFNGDHKNLVPGTWRYTNKDDSNDRVDTSSRNIRSLQQLFEAPKEIKTGNEILNELIVNSANRIAQMIKNYDPEG